MMIEKPKRFELRTSHCTAQVSSKDARVEENVVRKRSREDEMRLVRRKYQNCVTLRADSADRVL